MNQLVQCIVAVASIGMFGAPAWASESDNQQPRQSALAFRRLASPLRRSGSDRRSSLARLSDYSAIAALTSSRPLWARQRQRSDGWKLAAGAY
jgi:hypothetical protein